MHDIPHFTSNHLNQECREDKHRRGNNWRDDNRIKIRHNNTVSQPIPTNISHLLIFRTSPGKPAGTVTAYCPIPTTGTNCGVRGWGYATNNVYTGNADPASCHQLCLKTANCASFQVGDATDSSSQCNLYSVDASGNNTIAGSTSPFTFYDRDCTDLSPGCGGPKRDLAGRDSAAPKPPLWFQLLPVAQQYQICGCIVGTDTMYPGSTLVSTVTSTVTKSIVVCIFSEIYECEYEANGEILGYEPSCYGVYYVFCNGWGWNGFCY